MMAAVSTAKRTKRTAVCACVAYPFPHRAGSGKCDDPGPAPASCSECHNHLHLRDPYGTGDGWYTLIECRLDSYGDPCPWRMDKQ